MFIMYKFVMGRNRTRLKLSLNVVKWTYLPPNILPEELCDGYVVDILADANILASEPPKIDPLWAFVVGVPNSEDWVVVGGVPNTDAGVLAFPNIEDCVVCVGVPNTDGCVVDAGPPNTDDCVACVGVPKADAWVVCAGVPKTDDGWVAAVDVPNTDACVTVVAKIDWFVDVFDLKPDACAVEPSKMEDWVVGFVPKALPEVVVALANIEAAVVVEVLVVIVPSNTDGCVVLPNTEDVVLLNTEASVLVGLSGVGVVVEANGVWVAGAVNADVSALDSSWLDFDCVVTGSNTDADDAGVGVLNTIGFDDSDENADLAAFKNTELDIDACVTELMELDAAEELVVLAVGSFGEVGFDCDVTAVPNVDTGEGLIAVCVVNLGIIELETEDGFGTTSGSNFETTGDIATGATIDWVEGTGIENVISLHNCNNMWLKTVKSNQKYPLV